MRKNNISQKFSETLNSHMHHAPEIEQIVKESIDAFVQKYVQKQLDVIKNFICTNQNIIQKINFFPKKNIERYCIYHRSNSSRSNTCLILVENCRNLFWWQRSSFQLLLFRGYSKKVNLTSISGLPKSLSLELLQHLRHFSLVLVMKLKWRPS